MLTKRIIPCLDVDKGKVVKGVRFKNLRVEGEPAQLAAEYDRQQADELVFLDITASYEDRAILIDAVKKTAEAIFIPFTVGGGVRGVQDMLNILTAGADKVSINTAAVRSPKVVREASQRFGSQCVVVAVDAKRNYGALKGREVVETPQGPCWWEVYIEGGRTPTGLDALSWMMKVEKLGAGEILLTSMDCDGTRSGYDIELTKAAVERLNIPVIASGGAGSPDHIYKVLTEGGADAALAASIFHEGEYTVLEVKRFLRGRGVPVRIEEPV
ncbi:MAG: imidazole glycerol phosphate synthase subunit HisF [Candidatus Bathyarchaeia archaeon]